ncbi:5-formyltetrahydrofolate cyclo-ligase [Mucilaginibacter jinjuensis]|uniref:5-formyltetrahydrofolate cyclo-ligase n=1 Tax=Mucilaginibacter jinjuensis TaxID=1176721 RepID=A0ABY7T7A7_9SPHI|nr:5-formyltetrahydrofolate cyclo-ligase [Mucilaginibacter jinjuensis]WCT12374.1 5-formyltetrahydrofolate cyclo-ligase [Mucilaginibacter jinjuensis]
MKKEEIRKLFVQKRNQLTEVEYGVLCQKLFCQFRQFDLSEVRCIHLFLPIVKRKEPNTLLIRDWLKVNHPEIKIVYPKTNFTDHSMQSFADDESLVIKNNGYDIPEPVSGNQIPVDQIDLILIPLLAFDKCGYRVGYGKGFYDRFMAQCRPDTQFVGLSLFEAIGKIEDLDEYDMPMHACITPDYLYKF